MTSNAITHDLHRHSNPKDPVCGMNVDRETDKGNQVLARATQIEVLTAADNTASSRSSPLPGAIRVAD